ncbi:MAG: MFS transporter, partial [Muribaculaceae bacterium]|nr:MFS transporter [Muribaculaceae bacterium]
VAYAVVLAVMLHEKRHKAPVTSAKSPGTASNKEKMWKTFAIIFTNVAFWIILFFFASSSLPGWAIKNWLPTLFSDTLNLTPSEAGPLATITIAAASFVGVMIGGPLSDRWVLRNIRGRIYTSAIGLGMMVPALVCIGLGHNLFAAIGAALLFGVGYGMFDANNMPILCQFIPAHQRASAYGIMNMTGVLAGAVVTSVLGSWAAEGNLGLGFALMGVILVIALALQLFALRPSTDDASATTPTHTDDLEEDTRTI